LIGAEYGAAVTSRAADRIIREFLDWLNPRTDGYPDSSAWLAGADAGDALEVLLYARETWLGCPDPTRWRTGDAHRLLIDTAPARLTSRYGLDEHGVTVLRAYFDFLDETDRFHPTSTRTATLYTELTRAGAKFPGAMADRSRWPLAKSVLTAILADGVDPDDEDAVDTWTAAFSTAPIERRREVLGDLLDAEPRLRQCQFVVRGDQVAALARGAAIPDQLRRGDAGGAPYPPAHLPPAEELAAAARTCPMLPRLVSVGRFAGAGRPLNNKGELGKQDTEALASALGLTLTLGKRGQNSHPAMSELWHGAVAAELLRVGRTSVTAGPALAPAEAMLTGDGADEPSLRLWRELFEVMVSEPDARLLETIPHDFTRWWWAPKALTRLYRLGRLDLEELVKALLPEQGASERAGEKMLPTVAEVLIRTRMNLAVRLGALTATYDPELFSSSLTAEQWREVELLDVAPWAVHPKPGVALELTALGRYAVRENLLSEGADAPLA
jgi:hypothetical protein